MKNLTDITVLNFINNFMIKYLLFFSFYIEIVCNFLYFISFKLI